MKFIYLILAFIFLFKGAESGHWCKVIYNKESKIGELKKQLTKCKNSDNIFIAIHSEFLNSGHLLNS